MSGNSEREKTEGLASGALLALPFIPSWALRSQAVVSVPRSPPKHGQDAPQWSLLRRDDNKVQSTRRPGLGGESPRTNNKQVRFVSAPLLCLHWATGHFHLSGCSSMHMGILEQRT